MLEGTVEHVRGDTHVIWFPDEEDLLCYLQLKLGESHQVCRKLKNWIAEDKSTVTRVIKELSFAGLNSIDYDSTSCKCGHLRQAWLPLIHPSCVETREVVDEIFAHNRPYGGCTCTGCAGNKLPYDHEKQCLHGMGFSADHYLPVRKLRVGVHCNKQGVPQMHSNQQAGEFELDLNIVAQISPVACAAYAARESVLTTKEGVEPATEGYAFQILHPWKKNNKALVRTELQSEDTKPLPRWQAVHGLYQKCKVFKTTAPDNEDGSDAAHSDYCTFKPVWRGLAPESAKQMFANYTDIRKHPTFGGVRLSNPEYESNQQDLDCVEQQALEHSHSVWEHISHVKVDPFCHTDNPVKKEALSVHNISLHCLTMHPLKVLCDDIHIQKTFNEGVKMLRENDALQDEMLYFKERLDKVLKVRVQLALKSSIKAWYSNAANPQDGDVSYSFFSTKRALLEFMRDRLGSKHKSCCTLSAWLDKEEEYRKEASAMGLHCPSNMAWFSLDTSRANGNDRIENVKQLAQALKPAHNCTCERCMCYNLEPGEYNQSENCYQQAIRSCPGSHFVPVEIIECGIEIEPMTYKDPVIRLDNTELGVKLVMNVIPLICPVAKALGWQGSDFTSNAVQILHCLDLNTEVTPKRHNPTRHGAYQQLKFSNIRDPKYDLPTCAMELRHRSLNKTEWRKVYDTSFKLLMRDIKEGEIHFGGVNLHSQDHQIYSSGLAKQLGMSEHLLGLNDYIWNHVSHLRLRTCVYSLQKKENAITVDIDDAHFGPIALLMKEYKKQQRTIETNLQELQNGADGESPQSDTQESPQKSPQAIKRAAKKARKKQAKMTLAIQTLEAYIEGVRLARGTYHAIRVWRFHLEAEGAIVAFGEAKAALVRQAEEAAARAKDAAEAAAKDAETAKLYAFVVHCVYLPLRLSAEKHAWTAWTANLKDALEAAPPEAAPAPPEAEPAPGEAAPALTIDRAQCDCPITMEIMSDPVIAADGHTYEREAIESWLQYNNTSPMTDELMLHTHLMPNHLIRSIIQNSGLLE